MAACEFNQYPQALRTPEEADECSQGFRELQRYVVAFQNVRQ